MSRFNSPNLSNLQTQFPDSENHQSSPISIALNPQDAVSSHATNGDVCHVTYSAQYQLPQQAPVTNTPVQVNHPNIFFFRPPNDLYHYHVICKEISYDIVEHLLNNPLNGNINEDEYTFFYQQRCNDRFYQVSCEIVSPFLVNNCLSIHFLGVELEQNMEQERLAFTIDRKAHLEHHLKQYLSKYVLN